MKAMESVRQFGGMNFKEGKQGWAKIAEIIRIDHENFDLASTIT